MYSRDETTSRGQLSTATPHAAKRQSHQHRTSSDRYARVRTEDTRAGRERTPARDPWVQRATHRQHTSFERRAAPSPNSSAGQRVCGRGRSGKSRLRCGLPNLPCVVFVDDVHDCSPDEPSPLLVAYRQCHFRPCRKSPEPRNDACAHAFLLSPLAPLCRAPARRRLTRIGGTHALAEFQTNVPCTARSTRSHHFPTQPYQQIAPPDHSLTVLN
jgi:hypothetical protein